jgi:hypothetical protein
LDGESFGRVVTVGTAVGDIGDPVLAGLVFTLGVKPNGLPDLLLLLVPPGLPVFFVFFCGDGVLRLAY